MSFDNGFKAGMLMAAIIIVFKLEQIIAILEKLQ